MKLILISAVVGIAVGYISANTMFEGSWFALIFWGVVGIILGFFVTKRRQLTWAGIWYGFYLSLSFLISGFQGAPDKFFDFFILTIGLSILGALGGWVSMYAGYKVKNHFMN